MIFVVLGMHKSGTTLVARALHQSGIVMGQEFPENADYATLKYEAHNTQKINDEILNLSRKVFSLDVTSAALPADGVDEISVRRMQAMAAEMSDRYTDWGFKDPRTALTYAYWKQILPTHRVIVIYRDPIEVWRRYARVNHKWWSREAFKVWTDYNSKILESVDVTNHLDVLFLKFEDLLSTDKEWARLEKFAGKKIVDVRDPNQSKFRVTTDQRDRLSYRLLSFAAGKKTKQVYQQLEQLRSM